MDIMTIDIETYSDQDITKGVHKYVDSPSFTILLFAYAINDGPVKVIDLANGETIEGNQEAYCALYSEAVRKTAYNANFELTCLNAYFPRHGIAALDDKQWECDMIRACYNGYPPGLGITAKALDLAEDKQKDTRGKRLIQYFCKPCRPTKANGGRTRNFPEHAPEDWEMFKAYNAQDVVTERAIREALPLPVPEKEWALWRMDRAINGRGIDIDQQLAEGAIAISRVATDELMVEARELTGLENPNSPAQLKEWLSKNGHPVESLSKDAVKELLQNKNLHPKMRRMLEIRQKLSKTSIKKYQAMLDTVTTQDGRAHDLFQFYGTHTGRWAGRNIQLQNLPRNSTNSLDVARGIVQQGDYGTLDMMFDDVPDILSQLVRTALVPAEGHRFIVADFSAIEARVIAWAAGVKWRMEAFQNGEDIYCASASSMFGVPVVKHGVNGELRQKGKVAELACIAEGQEVLTNHGLKPIETVKQTDLVWDGAEFVAHDGLIFKGYREVVTYEGLTATPDHLVYIQGEPRAVRLEDAAARGSHLVQAGDGRYPIRTRENHFPRKEMEQELESLLHSDAMPGLRRGTMAGFRESENWKDKGLPVLLTAEADTSMAGQKADGGKATLRESEGQGLSELRGTGHPLPVQERDGGRAVSHEDVSEFGQKSGAGSYQQRRELRTWKYSSCDAQEKQFEQAHDNPPTMESERVAIQLQRRRPQAESGNDAQGDFSGRGKSGAGEAEKLEENRKKAPVYDLLNAGPRHRFTVSGKLVHNCGYGGGVNALKAFGADKMGLSDTALMDIVTKWREASPEIPQLWRAIEDAAFSLITDKWSAGKTKRFCKCGGMFSLGKDESLVMHLPSGRSLVYPRARFGKNRFGQIAILYDGINQTTRKWGAQETYGGKLTENFIQAVARDCLAAAMLRLEHSGYRIVAHIHDEVVLDTPEGHGSLEDVIRIMTQNEPWNEGLLMNADGFEAQYYKKD